ncbi:hypothetical protein [Sporosarcina sp. HYO08]|uniref:hypothetical protein n=1 Tax=Sporosarcina sp. HYO08 TaxID=1759557 RepID=UPI000795D225|nr:hypothetical protein [Sporosarcina sp. HYO08]KXH81688.1 hypothetical protein AU377_05300 [Sporosarcina sp. HYO08]
MTDLIENGDEKAKIEQTAVTQCASCGGNMEFSPETGALQCPFCGSTQEIERTQNNTIELNFLEALEKEDHSWDDEKRVFTCDSCGAETLLDQDKVADFCSFCGSSHITVSDHHAGIKPALVVPFQVSEKEAVEKFKVWIRKRYFAPNELKKTYRLNRLSGAYIPYWTFDADTQSAYVVQVGTYYYVTVTRTVYEDGQPRQVTEQVRKIRWHMESGRYNEFFDDVLVKASENVASGLVKRIEPFHLKDLVDYKMEYLSGFLAERYSISLPTGWQDAQQIIDRRIENGIRGQVYGDIVNITSVSTDYQDITYKHILLPIWISSFRYKDTVYRFLVNGQTGKVSGKAPISTGKVALVVIAVMMLVAFIIALLGNYS